MESSLVAYHDASSKSLWQFGVEFELIEKGIATVQTVMSISQERKAERERRMSEYWERQRQENRRKQFEELKKEFNG